MTTYTCQKCGVTQPALPLPCACKAPITANLQAVARGAGAVK